MHSWAFDKLYFWLGPSYLSVGMPPTSMKWELDNNDKQNHYRHTISSPPPGVFPRPGNNGSPGTHYTHPWQRTWDPDWTLFTDKQESSWLLKFVYSMWNYCESVWGAQDRWWGEVWDVGGRMILMTHKHKQYRARDMQPRVQAPRSIQSVGTIHERRRRNRGPLSQWSLWWLWENKADIPWLLSSSNSSWIMFTKQSTTGLSTSSISSFAQ